MGSFTQEELRHQIALRGVKIESTQLRSWRELGLLPAAMRGGVARYPADTVDQAIAAFRLFERKRSADFVGWHLWWQGFDVDERYWNPVIEKAGRRWCNAVKIVVRTFVRAKANEDAGDKFDRKLEPASKKMFQGTPMGASARNMSPNNLVSAIWLMVDAATGNYEGDRSTEHEAQRIRSLQSLAGMRAARSHSVQGSHIDVEAGLGDFLRACARLPRVSVDTGVFRGNRYQVFLGRRVELQNIFDTACDFYEATAWVYGRRAFGLKILVDLIRRGDPEAMATLLLLWDAIRENNAEFLDPAEIEELRREAAITLEASRAFKRLVDNTPELQPSPHQKQFCGRFAMRIPSESFIMKSDECRKMR